MATPSEKRALLSTYYSLREITERMNITDSENPRYHTPISYKDPIENLSVNDITVRMKEELDLIRIGLAQRAHVKEAFSREEKEKSKKKSNGNQ